MPPPQAEPEESAQGQKERKSPIAVLSLVLGALALFPYGWRAGIPAVIAGHIALYQINRPSSTLTGRELAHYGMALGYTMIALRLIILALRPLWSLLGEICDGLMPFL